MIMRPLDFDFAERRAPGWAGWVLLAAGVVFAADLARSYLPLRDEIPRIEARLAKSNEPKGLERHPVSAEEFAEARSVVARFAAPWPTLFAAIESVRIDDVALLAIEPDPASGHVLISGEGKDYLAVLTYVARLEAQPGLSRVHLSRHEVREAEPRRPVSFSVSARWRRT
jgi:hypothetical protein